MTRTESYLERDLRQLVVDRCAREAGDLRLLAEGLGVSSAAVEELMKKPHWDLGLTFRILDVLGMGLRVVPA